MANRDFTAVMLKLPALSVEALESLCSTIKNRLDTEFPDKYPLADMYYWHGEEIPEEWGEKLCKSLAELDSYEAESVLVQAAKIKQRKAKRKKQRRG